MFGKIFVHLGDEHHLFSVLLSSCNIHAVMGQHRYLSNFHSADDFKDDVVGALSVYNLIGSDPYYKFVRSWVLADKSNN